MKTISIDEARQMGARPKIPLKQDEETKEYFKDPECIEQNLYISLDDFLKQIDRD